MDGKYEFSGSSRIGALEESAIEEMIETARKIAHDYECGFGRTKDEKACGKCDTGCIARSRDVSAKKVALPCEKRKKNLRNSY